MVKKVEITAGKWLELEVIADVTRRFENGYNQGRKEDVMVGRASYRHQFGTNADFTAHNGHWESLIFLLFCRT